MLGALVLLFLASSSTSSRRSGVHRGFQWRTDPTKGGYGYRVLVPGWGTWPYPPFSPCFVVEGSMPTEQAAIREAKSVIDFSHAEAARNPEAQAWVDAARLCRWPEGALVS